MLDFSSSCNSVLPMNICPYHFNWCLALFIFDIAHSLVVQSQQVDEKPLAESQLQSILIVFRCIWVVVFATKFHFCTWREWALSKHLPSK